MVPQHNDAIEDVAIGATATAAAAATLHAIDEESKEQIVEQQKNIETIEEVQQQPLEAADVT